MLLVLLLVGGAVVTRLVYLQGVVPERYAQLGRSQRTATVALPADRGSIFDRNGRELALSIEQRTVWADPRLVTDAKGSAAALAPILQQRAPVLEQKLGGRGAFVYLARKVDDGVADRVATLELPGIFFLDEPRRFAPAGDLARAVLGTVGLDNDGLSGLERRYDDQLTGRPGELRFERAPDGSTIATGRHDVRPAERGDDLVLTIDRSLQFEAERQLATAVDKTGSLGGFGIVMDPTTGEILAMANVTAGVDGQPARPGDANRAATSVFEPGSVNKVITVAAALEEGLVNPDTEFLVPDKLQVSVHRFSDHDPHPPTRWSVTDILRESSNVGTIMIAQQLGETRLDSYLRRFGFGTRTGLNFPGEPRGILKASPKDWFGTDIGSIPIGQGISVTALQMLLAYNTVANGGVYVAPKLVKATIDGSGEQHPTAATGRRRVVSERTAREVMDMLTAVVQAGTGTTAAIPGYTVAGKTGTARKPSETTRGYERGAYMASFTGIVPAEAPRLSSIIVLDKPRGVYYASQVAAPVFASLAQYGLDMFRIPPPVPPVPVPGQPVGPVRGTPATVPPPPPPSAEE